MEIKIYRFFGHPGSLTYPFFLKELFWGKMMFRTFVFLWDMSVLLVPWMARLLAINGYVYLGCGEGSSHQLGTYLDLFKVFFYFYHGKSQLIIHHHLEIYFGTYPSIISIYHPKKYDI